MAERRSPRSRPCRPPRARTARSARAPTSPHWGMVVDQERCIGCWSCAVICKSENDLPLGMWWNRILTEGEALDQPEVSEGGGLEMHWLPLACQHCENAPCVKVCPVQATYHRDDGLVMMDNDRCIGCRYCMIACPYGVRTFNWGEPERPTPYETGMVEARPLGTVEKCTMCVHRLAEDQVPSCVWSCPTGARSSATSTTRTSRVVHAHPRARGRELLEELGTQPSVRYLPPRRRSPAVSAADSARRRPPAAGRRPSPPGARRPAAALVAWLAAALRADGHRRRRLRLAVRQRPRRHRHAQHRDVGPVHPVLHVLRRPVGRRPHRRLRRAACSASRSSSPSRASRWSRRRSR